MTYLKHFCVILLAIILSPGLFAHNNEHTEFLKKAKEIGKQLNEKENSLLSLVVRSEALLAKYDDDPVAKDLVSQFASTYYSFATEHAGSLAVADMRGNSSTLIKHIDNFGRYKSQSAIETIVTLAKERQIVMINEAHHVAQHRALTYDLIDKLWSEGYRYFALEALRADQFPFKAPLGTKSGYYTNEPLFAYLVKHAIDKGFILVPYDTARPSINTREAEAAMNIKERIFDQDPDAKVLIHVGYSHIDETGWLAKKLKDLLEIDPLTVDQVDISEKSKPEFETDVYREILARFPSDKPMSLSTEQGNLYSSQPDKWDLTVIWPRTRYVANKPEWMIKGRKFYTLDPSSCKGEFPCLVEVYDANSLTRQKLSERVPLDRTIILNEVDKKVVLLDNGEGFLTFTNKKGKVLSKQALHN